MSFSVSKYISLSEWQPVESSDWVVWAFVYLSSGHQVGRCLIHICLKQSNAFEIIPTMIYSTIEHQLESLYTKRELKVGIPGYTVCV